MGRPAESPGGAEFSKIQNSPHEAERLDILKGHGVANRQTVPTFGTSTRKAVFGRHTGTEAMLIDSFSVAGLKGSFHDENSNLWDEGINLVFIPLNFQGLEWFYLIFAIQFVCTL
jgi:hypothetical protein